MSARRRGRGVEGVLLVLALALFALGNDWLAHAPEFDPERRGPAAVRLVTWNVGLELLAGAPTLPAEHEAHVLAVLSGLRADVVVLQELAAEEQAEALAAALGPAWSSATSSRGAGRYVAILARDADLDRRRLRGVRGRAALATVRLRREPPVPAFVVAGVHAAAFSSEERNDLLGRVREQLDAGSEGAPRVLAGDFNLDLDPDAGRDLFSDDAYLDVQTYNAILAARGDRPGLVDAAADAGPTAEPDRRLDYVLFDGSAFEVLQAGPWRGRRAPRMDHDPLVVDLRARRGR